jgi:hypothetical protein
MQNKPVMASLNFLINCHTIFQLGIEMSIILQTTVKNCYFVSEVEN